MTDYGDYNHETPADRAARRQRAEAITSGRRGDDGLTVAERLLLRELRQAGYDIVRRGEFARYITKRRS